MGVGVEKEMYKQLCFLEIWNIHFLSLVKGLLHD